MKVHLFLQNQDESANRCTFIQALTYCSFHYFIIVAESLDAPEDLITMDNGCVCCSVRGDLIRTLGQLSSSRKKFDAILLETTGLADPAPIVYTVQSNPKISEHYRID
jgi:G3E family GTPase